LQHIFLDTPQQNGVVESKNQTLKEMANCMVQFKGLSLNFWVEAINCANYMVNHTPPKVLNNNTPEEAWSSIKPDVSHFCVFESESNRFNLNNYLTIDLNLINQYFSQK